MIPSLSNISVCLFISYLIASPTLLIEPIFLISILVPNGVPGLCSDTLQSHLIEPSSIFTSLIPKYNNISLNLVKYATASSGLLISGLDTISINGTPALLAFNIVPVLPWILLHVSSSICNLSIPIFLSPISIYPSYPIGVSCSVIWYPFGKSG